MTIEYKDSKRIVKLSTDTLTSATRSDFTGTWTSGGTTNKIAASNGTITVTINTDNNVDARLTYDMGAGNVSDSIWILRAKLVYTHNISASGACTIHWGMADNTTITGENAGGANDLVGGVAHLQDNTNNTQNAINGSGVTGNNRDNRMSTGNTYYIELKRVSVTSVTMKVFSDVSYSTQVGATSSATLTSALTGGRYFFFHHFTQTVNSGSGSLVFSDMKFYNSISEIISKPTDVQNNSILIEKDTAKRYWFDSGTWALAYARYDATRGVSCGGWSSVGATDSMDWITIATIGNAADFGNLTAARRNSAGVSSHTRGCMGGGIASSRTNTIDYITIASTGNATDFGDLSTATESNDGVNSDVRGIFGGGHTGAASNTMDYITIDTTGNTTDFGDLTVARANINAVMSEVRGVYGSGSGASVSNMMDYITIATTGNATDFGDLSVARYGGAGLNSVVRGVWAGGEASGFSAVMDYITIATTGNATDFGDLTVARNSIRGGVSSATRGVACGGHTFSNVMDYITIDTTGNATDFGDLMFAKYGVTGVQA
jgi:hypothetical protein